MPQGYQRGRRDEQIPTTDSSSSSDAFPGPAVDVADRYTAGSRNFFASLGVENNSRQALDCACDAKVSSKREYQNRYANNKAAKVRVDKTWDPKQCLHASRVESELKNTVRAVGSAVLSAERKA